MIYYIPNRCNECFFSVYIPPYARGAKSDFKHVIDYGFELQMV